MIVKKYIQFLLEKINSFFCSNIYITYIKSTNSLALYLCQKYIKFTKFLLLFLGIEIEQESVGLNSNFHKLIRC